MAIKILDNETTEKRDTKISSKATVEEYVNQTDWRVNSNANTGGAATHPALINTSAGKIIANYWLDQVYSKKEGDAHRNGDYHIHDLDNLAAYCFTKDTKVKTVEYGDISIEELLVKNVESFTVKSTDLEAVGKYELKVEEDITEEDKVFFYKHFMNKTARNLRKTRENAELVAVEFEDGLVVKCTPDHKFLTATTMVAEKYTPYMVFAWDVAEMLKKGDKIVSVNGCTKVIKEVTKLPNREDVYCMEVEDTHCFALENGAVVHNCCGHDLQKLLNEGFNGVAGRVGSKAPKHIREALYQMANFIGILQAEWAGAQAFSSFDTYLAPLVFFDMNYGTLNFDELKKAVRNFVFNLNVPSRWGQCVPSTYKALKADGTWVSKDELKVGDEIFVIDMETGVLKKDTITHLNEFDAPEVMHKYSNKHGFNFQVTPNHRVIYKTGSNDYRIEESAKLLGRNVDIPISSWNKETVETFCSEEYEIADEMLELVAFIMTDGCLMKQEGKKTIVEFYKSPLRWGSERFEEICELLGIQLTRDERSSSFGGSCYRYRMVNSSKVDELVALLGNDRHIMPDWFSKLSPRQCYKVIDTWVLLDGHFDGCHWKMQADTREMQEMLAYLTVKAGKATSLTSRVIGGNKEETKYTLVHKRGCRSCEVTEVAPITDKVWCPTTNTGTFVCMTDEGYVFLTGNSPFSNITIDLKCPNDLKDRNPMREHKPFFVSIYEEYKETLDKVRSAIKEQGIGVMPEGITEKDMEVFMSWEILMQSAEDRLKDFDEYTEDMDEETVCYSLCYKHFDKEMKLITKAYYEVMNEGDAFGLPFTFPIPTINIGEDFDWDNPEYDVIWDNTAKYGSSYFQNFIGSQYLRDENGELTIRDENAYSPNDVRSMCPLTFDTKVVARSGQDASFRKIGEMYHTAKTKGTKYECFYNGDWVKCSVIRVEPQTIHRITLANNRTYSMGELHEQPICRNGETMNVMARDIRVGDLIPFNTSVVDAEGTNSSYELGYALGAYLGDGSHDGSETITYSLCADEKDDETEKVLRKFWEGNGFHTRVKVEGRVRSLVVTGKAFSLISKFIAGKTALDKGIVANILNQSVDMRRGIVDGYIATDGQRANGRISTSSERMVEDLVMLFNSLGIKAYKSFTDTREGRFGEAPNMTVSHITEKQNFKGKYATIDGQLYWYVTDIEVNSNTNTPLYCLVTESEEHLFTLGDGLITHNCRLQLDKRALRKRGGGLFGSDSQTGSIGVVTINLARIGYNFKGDKKAYLKQLYKLMDMAKSTLEKKRAFVTEMVKRGLYPYTRRYVNSALNGFTTYFSTIGVNGMNESIRNFTNDEHDITDEWGQEFAKDVMAKIRERLLQYQEETGNLYNAEASPGEGCLHQNTLILNDLGKWNNISDLAKEGTANLLSFNRKTGKTEVKPAKVFLDSVSSKHYVIGFKNGLVIECTTEHPFAVVKDDDFYWSPASGLVAGDVIKGLTQDMEVVSIGIVEEEMPVYNATVEDNENFYMGDEEHGFILTHNTTYRFAKEDAKRFGDKEVHYIICEKHGRVEVESTEGEIECPLCASEKNND